MEEGQDIDKQVQELELAMETYKDTEVQTKDVANRKKLVEEYGDDEISSNEAVQVLKLHLRALVQFKKEEDECYFRKYVYLYLNFNIYTYFSSNEGFKKEAYFVKKKLS